MGTLTDRQGEVLDIIRQSIVTHGFAPTLDEIREVIGCSLRGARLHVDVLERKGYVTRTPHKARSIQLTEKAGAKKTLRELISAIDAALEEMRVA